MYIHYIATRSTFIPCSKSYNQRRLELEFQIERNPYTKQTLITMENINVSTTTDRHIVIIVVTNPTLSPAYHRQSANHLRSTSATTSIINRHRSITTPGLGHILLFHHRYQPSSATLLSTSHHFIRLPMYTSLTPRYVSKDTCPKTVSTLYLGQPEQILWKDIRKLTYYRDLCHSELSDSICSVTDVIIFGELD